MVAPSQFTSDPAVHLGIGDVRVDNADPPALIQVRLKSSKTDPFRKGVSIYLGATGCCDSQLHGMSGLRGRSILNGSFVNRKCGLLSLL